MKKLLVYINLIYVVFSIDIKMLENRIKGEQYEKSKLIKLKEMLEKYVDLKSKFNTEWDYNNHGDDRNDEVYKFLLSVLVLINLLLILILLIQ